MRKISKDQKMTEMHFWPTNVLRKNEKKTTIKIVFISKANCFRCPSYVSANETKFTCVSNKLAGNYLDLIGIFQGYLTNISAKTLIHFARIMKKMNNCSPANLNFRHNLFNLFLLKSCKGSQVTFKIMKIMHASASMVGSRKCYFDREIVITSRNDSKNWILGEISLSIVKKFPMLWAFCFWEVSKLHVIIKQSLSKSERKSLYPRLSVPSATESISKVIHFNINFENTEKTGQAAVR